MKKINIQPLVKILGILLTERPKQQNVQNKVILQENNSINSFVKKTITKPAEKLKSTVSPYGPEQQETVPGNQNCIIVPVPIKTTLFDKAQFLYREPGSPGAEQTTKSCGILIKLETVNLGKLWITLTSTGDIIVVKFFNHKTENIEVLKKYFPVLEEELSKTFKNIYIKGQVCTDAWLQKNILKDFEESYKSFLNLIV